MLVLYDPRCLLHDPGPGHPESAERLRVAHAELLGRPLPGLRFEVPPLAPHESMRRVHGPDLLSRLEDTVLERHTQFDADTGACPESWTATRLAAGAALRATEACLIGECRRAFALVRPPGHHTGADHPAGFCLLNGVAIAAAHAVADCGCERVMILDQDVHHGNGTQAIFWRRGDVAFVSSHRSPFYPGSGAAEERGEGPGAGLTLNLPLDARTDDAGFLEAWHGVEPLVREFRPELLLVSAGFDAWEGDPVGGLRITVNGFRALARLFRSWADSLGHGRVVWVLEGGYDPVALAACVRATLEESGPPGWT